MAENPYYRFFRRLHFPMPIRMFDKLPRIPSYKNEYWDGEVRLTPRPNTCNVYLDIDTWTGPPEPDEDLLRKGEIDVRPLQDEDWPHLPKVYHGSFADQQPLCAWNHHAAARASRCIIEWTRLGRDGPI